MFPCTVKVQKLKCKPLQKEHLQLWKLENGKSRLFYKPLLLLCVSSTEKKKEKTFLSANIIHWVNKNKLIQVYFLTNSKPYTQVKKKIKAHTWYFGAHSLCIDKCLLLQRRCSSQLTFIFIQFSWWRSLFAFPPSVYITFHSLLLHSHLMTCRLHCLICQKWK